MTKAEELKQRVGKVIEKSFRAKVRDKAGKTRGYFDVQMFAFAEDEKAQASIEKSLEWITNHLPQNS
jgi:hypothetical protein